MRPHELAKKYKFLDPVYRLFLRIWRHYVYKQDTSNYNKWFNNQKPDEEELSKQRATIFKKNIKFSFVIPLYQTPIRFLLELINSIKAQTYYNWEICFSDGGGEDSSLKDFLIKMQSGDDRIKVINSKEKLNISDNTNLALSLVDGDYIIFGDHDDVFAPNALYECAKVLEVDDDIDIIYSDEDKINSRNTKHMQPAFKPDFNLDMIRSTNYFCHLTCVRRSFQKKIGGLRKEFDGAQDYDFVLRCLEKTDKIFHIPKVLYHWRAHNNSTAKNQKTKNYAFDAGKEALCNYYEDLNIKAKVSSTKIEDTIIKGIYRTTYKIDKEPLVSIIIPNKDHVEDLEKCIDSIYKVNNYKNFEIIIVENNSNDNATFDFYKNLMLSYDNINVVYFKEKVFNFSAINNFGVRSAKGEYVLFLNNDTEFILPESIYEMISNCMREEIGAVGAKLIFSNKKVQHAGVVLGLCGVASHCFSNETVLSPGYCGRLVMSQNYNACTAACLMVEKKLFNTINGFDERFAVAYNDIDLCLRIRKLGYLITFTPYSQLYHYESKSRGYETTPEKRERFNKEVTLFKQKWQEKLDHGDEYYNPNLNRESTNISLNSEK